MRLRFTIRDLLWLAVVVALAVGWWVDRSSYKDAVRDRDQARRRANSMELEHKVLQFQYFDLRREKKTN
jgi:hypothetical protein